MKKPSWDKATHTHQPRDTRLQRPSTDKLTLTMAATTDNVIATTATTTDNIAVTPQVTVCNRLDD